MHYDSLFPKQIRPGREPKARRVAKPVGLVAAKDNRSFIISVPFETKTPTFLTLRSSLMMHFTSAKPVSAK